MVDSHGRFVWYELMTTDSEAAKAFYAKVVGWGTRDASPVSQLKDDPVLGLNGPLGEKRTFSEPVRNGRRSFASLGAE
jgi:predicted enzyme related to lactoylglutathione lyase